jgi:hypothetical protein
MLSKPIIRRNYRDTTGRHTGQKSRGTPRGALRNDLPRRSGGGGSGSGGTSQTRGAGGALRRAMPFLRTLGYLRYPMFIWNFWQFLKKFEVFTGTHYRSEGFTAFGAWTPAGQCPNGPTLTYPGPLVLVSTSSNTTPPVSNSFVLNCLQNQAYQAGSEASDAWNFVSSSSRTAIFGWKHALINRCRLAYQYTRSSSGTFDKPLYLPEIDVVAQYSTLRMPKYIPQMLTYDPMTQPVADFAPFPGPMPYKAIPEWTHPLRETRYHVTLRPPLKPNQKRLALAVVVEARPDKHRSKPRTKPQTQPSAPVRPPIRPPNVHVVSPPSKGEKERKLKVTGPAYAAIKFLNEVTEAKDFVEVLHNSLPESLQARYRNTTYRATNPSVYDQLKAIYANWDSIQVDKAVEGLFYEQLEDMLYGKLGKMSQSIAEQHGHHYGGGLNSITSRAGQQARYQLRRFKEGP